MLKFLPVLLVFSVCILFFLKPQTTQAASRGIPILTYHYVRDYNNPKDPTGNGLSVSPGNFSAQMDYLSAHGFTPITLDTMYAILSHKAGSPAKPIVLTFDDGYIDFYANAYPVLKAHNFQAVSFIVTGFVGRPAYLSWDNISEMYSSGLISFQARTVDHAYLPNLSYQQVLRELIDSKNALQSHIGYTVNSIAYPYGASNGFVIKAAQKSGFYGGIGTWFGRASSVSLNMPRIRIANFSLSTFASRVE